MRCCVLLPYAVFCSIVLSPRQFDIECRHVYPSVEVSQIRINWYQPLLHDGNKYAVETYCRILDFNFITSNTIQFVKSLFKI